MEEEEIREDREVLYTCAFSIVSVGDMGTVVHVVGDGAEKSDSGQILHSRAEEIGIGKPEKGFCRCKHGLIRVTERSF